MTKHFDYEPFYFMGRRDVEQDKVHITRPTGWNAYEWFAYQDGMADAQMAEMVEATRGFHTNF